MRKIFTIVSLFLGLIPSLSVADTIQPVLNQVMFQTTAEQWVTTKTAQVVVGVDATLNEDKLAKAHTDILKKLEQLVPSTDWHITQFNRNPDKSGLEQLQVQAEARLAESALASLRDRAKAMSKPGETYTVQSINFIPTIAEIEAVRNQLRNQVYKQIETELSQLNKTYPNQKYVVHLIDFNDQNIGPKMMPRMMMAVAESADAGAAAMPVTVANKIIMSARVILVSVNQ